MIVISNPIHIITGESPEAEISRVNSFLEADRVERDREGPKIQDFYLVGPQLGDKVSNVLKTFSINCDIPADNLNEVGWGVWMPPCVEAEDAPLVKTFRLMPQFGVRPVMTSEHRLRAGELIAVPRTSELFVVITTVDGGPLPPDVKWLTWSSDGGSGHQSKSGSVRPLTHEPHTSSADTNVVEGRVVRASRPWLTDPEPEVTAALNAEATSFQLTPMLHPDDAAKLARCVAAGPWARRVGDIYTQDGLDIVGWSMESDCPDIVKRVVDAVHDPTLVGRIARLTGVEVESLREMFAYRLRAGDRILLHADTTYGGELMVRANWLLQTPGPPARPWDFRFWNPEQPKAAPTGYASRPNRAVFFLFGNSNPHDVPVIPEGAPDRLNIVISFGRAKRGD